jgi:6-phosphogluconolactonase/glucosamine-6-phosphate isomerase/deaminase
MKFLRADDNSWCIDALVTTITTQLRLGREVLWFMTGGSNIAIDIAVLDRLDENLTEHLTVTLTDERYGDYGHQDSNWQQLLDGGMQIKKAHAFSVLQTNNPSLGDTVALYEENLQQALTKVDTVIGFYGLGSDGHIAGILPGTPAVSASGLAIGYETEQFTRITTTFQTIRRNDIAFMYASGDSKQQPLHDLASKLPLAEQPAQILKELPAAYIYNDLIGDQV